jgi:phosphomannomutase
MLHTKDLIIFDVDDTLTRSKCEMSDEMSEVFSALLQHKHVAIISGGKWEVLKKNIVDRVHPDYKNYLHRLHILPTCGARYFRYEDNEWREKHAYLIKEEDKSRIRELLLQAAEGEYERKEVFGELVEDRKTMMSFSMFGQFAPIHIKEPADRDHSLRRKMIAKIAHLLPEYELRTGGATTIDVTQKGMDKGFGIRSISDTLSVPFEKILFVGDATHEGGNDYPAVTLGLDVITVKNPQETLEYIRKWLV